MFLEGLLWILDTLGIGSISHLAAARLRTILETCAYVS
jgi:hypothetical protein